MNFTFHRKRIAGVFCVVPENERSFLDDMRGFNAPEARSLKLKEVMGYDTHRLVEADVCVSDLVIFGMQQLFEKGHLQPDNFDAFILVTQSPDYFMPPTSSVIHGKLGLKKDIFCLDINQGCAGFIVGLIQAFMMLDQPNINKVVLVNADVISRKVSPKDKNSYPLIGDAASITILERDCAPSLIHANLKMDGSSCDALMIPAGGFKTPSTPETGVLEDVGDDNMRAKDHLRMNGSAVFNFVQTEVPKMLEELLNQAGASDQDISYYICHQPNRFMLQKLADKMKVPHSKFPMNVVEKYGNSSGVTIPLALAHNFPGLAASSNFSACLAGFGVGLTWGSVLLQLGDFRFCEIVEYPSLL